MTHSMNLVQNGNFARGQLGGMPEGWSFFSPEDELAPDFRLGIHRGEKVLVATGNGNEHAVGWAHTSVQIEKGQTYRMKVRFCASDDVHPYEHLLFSIYVGKRWDDFNNGIFTFRETAPGEFEGENTFFLPGKGVEEGEVRLAYRLHAAGYVAIREIELVQTEPLPERNVRVACVQGWSDQIPLWEQVIGRAAELGADLILLPETFTGDKPALVQQPIDGECAQLMERMARKHSMYVAGTFLHRDEADGRLRNTALLFDREGRKIGRYDKTHLFSPELMDLGITPGDGDVQVFDTDFGKVGILICYDFWFTDVAELLALRGAEIVMVPNAGYYRSIMPARANDNGVRIMASSMYGTAGIWDTSGADVERPDLDPTRESKNDRTFKDVVREKVAHFELLLATFDMNESPSAHNWGGPMKSAPGGRRNRREEKKLLYEQIIAEYNKRSIDG